MLRNVHAAEMMENVTEDVLADENEEGENEDLVGDIVSYAHDSMLSTLPRPPDAPPMIGGMKSLQGTENDVALEEKDK